MSFQLHHSFPDALNSGWKEGRGGRRSAVGWSAGAAPAKRRRPSRPSGSGGLEAGPLGAGHFGALDRDRQRWSALIPPDCVVAHRQARVHGGELRAAWSDALPDLRVGSVTRWVFWLADRADL